MSTNEEKGTSPSQTWPFPTDSPAELPVDETPRRATGPLAKIVGNDPMSRGAIVKRVWDHIKRNGLQDEGDPRMINTDEALKTLCGGTAQVSLFDLTGFIGRHVKPVKGKGN